VRAAARWGERPFGLFRGEGSSLLQRDIDGTPRFAACGFKHLQQNLCDGYHSDEFIAAARDNPEHLRGQMLAVGGPVPIGQRGFEIDLEVISRLSDITQLFARYRRYVAEVSAIR
jgi:hypothetical protein